MEVRMDDTPLEAGLMFTCKLKTDTDFQGRTALEQRKAGGVKRKKVRHSAYLAINNCPV